MVYDILIQIINYNTKHHLDCCLEGLFADLENSGINYKVIVLDNNSNDDLRDIEKKYAGKNIQFHYSKKNLGFGGGHNLISKMEKSRYLLILNADIKFIGKNTISNLYKRIYGSDYNVIGPKLVLEDLTPQSFDHGELKGVFSWVKNNYGSSYWVLRNKETEAAWVSGAVFMIESDTFLKVKGFDDNFFLYKEEEDLCKRILEAGGKILYYPMVLVMHIGHVVASRNEHYDNSMNYYLDKHFRNKISYKILNNIKIIKDLILYQEVKARK